MSMTQKRIRFSDGKSRKQKTPLKEWGFYMVHPRGFEPLTARFVAGYSIQLSYGCEID